MGTLSQSISKTPRPPSRWPGRVNTELRDRRSSTLTGIAGGSPPCSVTRRRRLLTWGRLARAGAAMRSNFSSAPELKFQIFLARLLLHRPSLLAAISSSDMINSLLDGR
jgi:hypothetical protein